ncbi:hypothetical protein KC951_01350 [Candidatus Saccharibacteria bacterium]|nr:hypothetical protein [Candidatus Saccharibacteria bacterium]
MKLYRFSPIKSADTCTEVLEHIQKGLRELSELVLEESLPINTLKIFAHYEDEYKFLKQWVDSIGEAKDEGSSTSYYVEPSEAMTVNNDPIEYVGIRVPDPYRAQVGCGDYVVDSFDKFKTKYLGKSPFIREVAHPKYEMLELFHPDIDVLGYIVKEYE